MPWRLHHGDVVATLWVVLYTIAPLVLFVRVQGVGPRGSRAATSFARSSSPFANQTVNPAPEPMEAHMETLHANLTSLAALLLLSLAPAQVGAQETPTIAQCRSTTLDAERLSCYDKAVDGEEQTARAQVQGSYKTISLTDLKLDQANMSGRHIEVAGNLILTGRLGLLGSDYKDSSPLVVDMKAVPREQQRVVLDRCRDYRCTVSVRGTVGQVISMPGIVADVIEMR